MRALLKDAFNRRVPIGAFDFCGREQVVSTLRAGLKPMLLTMHGVRPRRRSALVLTYLLPILPAMILWDAAVSNLRAYSPTDLSDLVADLQTPDWRWTTGRLESRLQPVASHHRRTSRLNRRVRRDP